MLLDASSVQNSEVSTLETLQKRENPSVSSACYSWHTEGQRSNSACRNFRQTRGPCGPVKIATAFFIDMTSPPPKKKHSCLCNITKFSLTVTDPTMATQYICKKTQNLPGYSCMSPNSAWHSHGSVNRPSHLWLPMIFSKQAISAAGVSSWDCKLATQCRLG